jgi:signal recognition particle subunit SRP54
MVLADLGNKITKAIANMRNSTVIDEEVVEEMLKEIGNALIAADVQFLLAAKLKKNIKAKINFADMPAGLNKRKIIQKVCNKIDQYRSFSLIIR